MPFHDRFRFLLKNKAMEVAHDEIADARGKGRKMSRAMTAKVIDEWIRDDVAGVLAKKWTIAQVAGGTVVALAAIYGATIYQQREVVVIHTPSRRRW